MSNQMAILAADPSLADHTPDPAAYFIEAMDRARELLATLQPLRDIDAIVALRVHTETVRAYIRHRGLGRPAELAATEMARRAERAVGLAIRAGQEAGTIRPSRSHTGNQYTAARPSDPRPSPLDYATKGELMGGGGDGGGRSKAGFYDLADGISDEEFEQVLTQAREEGALLTRAHLIRKLRELREPSNGEVWVPGGLTRGGDASVQRRKIIREMAGEGYSSYQIGDRLGTLDGTVRRIAREENIDIPADKTMTRANRPDSNRIVEETSHILGGAVMSLQLVDPSELDPDQVKDWAVSLTDATRAINRFTKSMKETIQ